MSNEGILSNLGYQKDLLHLKQYVIWNILCRIIYLLNVAGEEICVEIMTSEFDYPLRED